MSLDEIYFDGTGVLPESPARILVGSKTGIYQKAVQKNGYHLKEISKGVYGEISKIREELEELEDAAAQECVIMEAVELADLYGSIEAYAKKLGYTMDDLQRMSNVTKRAFQNGKRQSGPSSAYESRRIL